MGKNKERKAIEERRIFTWPEKYEMLLKSDSKCAHCGRDLTVETFTAEHFIPLSKGGTNDMDNMVALCSDCNRDKSDFIYEPKSYYKYLKKDVLKTIQANYESYITTVNWLSLNNVYPIDEFPCKYQIITKDRKGDPKMVTSSIRIKKASPYEFTSVDESVRDLLPEDMKISECDRKRLYEFIHSYNMGNGVECTDAELKGALDEYFDKGCLYYAESAGEIKLALPVRVENRYVESLQREHYCLVFGNPMCLNENATSADLAASLVEMISREILSLAAKCGVPSSIICIEMMVKNYWYRTMTALKTTEIRPSGWGIFVDASDVKAQLLKHWGGEIPKGKFHGVYYLRSTDGKKHEFVDGLAGIGGYTISNEELVRWDRFIQKFCGTHDIHYHSGSWNKGFISEEDNE